VAAVAAELFEAPLYKATPIGHIYDGPPDSPDSAPLTEISVDRLRDVVQNTATAGDYAMFDGTAIDVIERSSIETKVISGELSDIHNPADAEGTRIVHP